VVLSLFDLSPVEEVIKDLHLSQIIRLHDPCLHIVAFEVPNLKALLEHDIKTLISHIVMLSLLEVYQILWQVLLFYVDLVILLLPILCGVDLVLLGNHLDVLGVSLVFLLVRILRLHHQHFLELYISLVEDDDGGFIQMEFAQIEPPDAFANEVDGDQLQKVFSGLSHFSVGSLHLNFCRNFDQEVGKRLGAVPIVNYSYDGSRDHRVVFTSLRVKEGLNAVFSQVLFLKSPH